MPNEEEQQRLAEYNQALQAWMNGAIDLDEVPQHPFDDDEDGLDLAREELIIDMPILRAEDEMRVVARPGMAIDAQADWMMVEAVNVMQRNRGVQRMGMGAKAAVAEDPRGRHMTQEERKAKFRPAKDTKDGSSVSIEHIKVTV
jgi:hypothetical protein